MSTSKTNTPYNPFYVHGTPIQYLPRLLQTYLNPSPPLKRTPSKPPSVWPCSNDPLLYLWSQNLLLTEYDPYIPDDQRSPSPSTIVSNYLLRDAYLSAAIQAPPLTHNSHLAILLFEIPPLITETDTSATSMENTHAQTLHPSEFHPSFLKYIATVPFDTFQQPFHLAHSSQNDYYHPPTIPPSLQTAIRHLEKTDTGELMDTLDTFVNDQLQLLQWHTLDSKTLQPFLHSPIKT